MPNVGVANDACGASFCCLFMQKEKDGEPLQIFYR